VLDLKAAAWKWSASLPHHVLSHLIGQSLACGTIGQRAMVVLAVRVDSKSSHEGTRHPPSLGCPATASLSDLPGTSLPAPPISTPTTVGSGSLAGDPLPRLSFSNKSCADVEPSHVAFHASLQSNTDLPCSGESWNHCHQPHDYYLNILFS
jgi:hypothetical protein